MRKTALLTFGLVVAFLVALGLVVLSSASGSNATRYGHDVHFFLKRQFLYCGVGLILATAAALIDYRKWRDYPVLTWFAFAVVFVLLLLVFPPFGRRINGSFRWIDMGFFNLQPSELAKMMIVIALAAWLDRAGWRVELLKIGFVIPLVFIALMAGPVILEPDFGSTLVIGLVSAVVMILAGVRWLHLLYYAMLGGSVFCYRVFTNANRMARIASYIGIKLNIGAEVADAAAERASHQVNQALVAFGRGGVGGVGLGESMQKHQYLPEAHTDFIFAIGGEEMGILFSLGVVILFTVFFALSIYIARKASDRFGRFLVMGMSFIIYFQAMFNIGVVCKALPTKGMALPFFSYGGTNMICAFIEVGLILSVGIHTYRDRKRKLGHG